MAASESNLWNVFITVEEDESLNKAYRLSPSTTLSELTQIWKDENKMFGRWLFESAKEDVIYNKEWMTLEMIGLSLPKSKVLNLVAKFSDEPTPRAVNGIYVCINKKCHHIQVNPQERLVDVMRSLPIKSKTFMYNGVPLNLKHTVDEAGLENNSFIYELLKVTVTVKLSTGYSTLIQLSSGSAVLHLFQEVNKYEMGAFSLVYRGRHLDLEDRVTDLKGVVEVSRADFNVDINGRQVTWTTGSRPISFPEFLSRLQFEGQLNAESLHSVKFYCTGCGRCICDSDGGTQILPIDCCRIKSMTLKAVSQIESSAQSDQNELVKYLKSLCEHQLQSEETNPGTAASRNLYRTTKEAFERFKLNYNLIIECGEKVKRRIGELEKERRILENQIETLKTEIVESNEEVEKLKIKNLESVEKIKILTEEKRRLSNPQGVTAAAGASSPPVEDLGVELMVTYWSRKFSPVPRPDVQQGEYPWATPYIKCRVPGIVPGLVRFEDLRDALAPLFTARHGDIQVIGQFRGEVAGMAVAAVTSREDEREMEVARTPFCTADGEEYSWRETTKPEWQDIREGDRVLVCDGRRTLLDINS